MHEDDYGYIATVAQAEREWVWNVGRDTPDRCWILSDRDAWYRNPFYVGPEVRHPEDWSYEDEDDTTPAQDVTVDVPVAIISGGWSEVVDGPTDEDIPF